MNRFQFVADHRDTYEVKRLCQVLEINRSSFYAWVEAAPAREQRAVDDQVLADRIRAVQKDDPAYGAPRVTAELNDGAPEGERVNHKRVARVMRAIKAMYTPPSATAGRIRFSSQGQSPWSSEV